MYAEREAFGADAVRVALRYPEDLPVIFADGADPARAQLAAVTRRRSGRAFYCAPIIQEPRALIALQVGPALLEQFATLDDRRSAFDGLATDSLNINGQAIKNIAVFDSNRIKALRDFMLLGDALLVSSEAELKRVRCVLGRDRPYSALAPTLDPSVPPFRRKGEADTVVVWAPRLQAREVAVIAFGLADIYGPLVIICAGGALPGGIKATIVGIHEAQTWLERALVVVDATSDEPGSALALCAGETALVVSSTSGAAEFLRGAFVYDPWSWRSVSQAVAAARGAQPTMVRNTLFDRSDLDRTLAASVPRPAPDPPLVTIVVPTYNRRSNLMTCLQSIERQTYPRVEALVINDAGQPVDDIVAQFPRARLINLEENVRVVRAVNVGLAHAAGEYIGLLADDDVIYPDHVLRLATALQRGHNLVAHSNIIMNLQTPGADGAYKTYGFLGNFDGYLDRTEILFTSPISAQGYLVHRSVYQQAGPLDASLRCTSDYELTLRLSRTFDFVHVDYITGEMTYRNDGTNESAMAGRGLIDEFALLFERYPSQSALVAAGRAAMLGHYEARVGRGSFFEPAVRLPD